MSFSITVGLALALLTACGSVGGFLLKFRGARQAPSVDLRRPLASTVALLRSPVYSLGITLGLASWMVHVGALALAPISLVQATIAGGLVLLTVLADGLFAIAVSRREWIGVVLAAAGLAILAATFNAGGAGAHPRYDPGRLALFLGVVSGAGLLLCGGGPRAMALAVSAGLLWAASDTSIKALSTHLHALGFFGTILHPLVAVVFFASMIGLLVSARSLQLGEAVPVIAVTSAAANLVTIAAGPIVFGEALSGGGPALVLRAGAFVLVVVGAALTPPPLAGESPQDGPLGSSAGA